MAYIFSMFCRLNFKFRFDHMLSDSISGSFLHHLSENIFPKKSSGTAGLLHQNPELWTCPEIPNEAGSRVHFSNKKQQFEHTLQKTLLDFMSCARKCCLNSFLLQTFQSMLDEMKSMSHYSWSGTPWAKTRRTIKRINLCETVCLSLSESSYCINNYFYAGEMPRNTMTL